LEFHHTEELLGALIDLLCFCKTNQTSEKRLRFLKNGKGEDVMTGAPSVVPEKTLKEVGIQYYDDPKKMKKVL
jgi:aspartyl-tRNA synthetase